MQNTTYAVMGAYNTFLDVSVPNVDLLALYIWYRCLKVSNCLVWHLHRWKFFATTSELMSMCVCVVLFFLNKLGFRHNMCLINSVGAQYAEQRSAWF